MDKFFDASQLEKFVGKLEKLPQESTPIFLEAMQESTQLTLGEVVDRTPVTYGNLRGSITAQVEAIQGAVIGTVGTSVPYALWVEEDTKPHWPPLQPLIDWVQKKQIAGTYSIQTRRRLGSKANIQAENIALAKMVQKKIAMQGTTGKHMFRDGLAAADEEIDKIFEQATKKVIATILAAE